VAVVADYGSDCGQYSDIDYRLHTVLMIQWYTMKLDPDWKLYEIDVQKEVGEGGGCLH